MANVNVDTGSEPDSDTDDSAAFNRVNNPHPGPPAFNRNIFMATATIITTTIKDPNFPLAFFSTRY